MAPPARSSRMAALAPSGRSRRGAGGCPSRPESSPCARSARAAGDGVAAGVERLHGEAVGGARDQPLLEVAALEHLSTSASHASRAGGSNSGIRPLRGSPTSTSDMSRPALSAYGTGLFIPIGRPTLGIWDAHSLRRDESTACTVSDRRYPSISSADWATSPLKGSPMPVAHSNRRWKASAAGLQRLGESQNQRGCHQWRAAFTRSG